MWNRTWTLNVGLRSPSSPRLTQASPHKSKQQCEENVSPVPLVLCCYGNNTQEEEDEGLWDGAEHLDHVSDGCAGTLRNVLLNIVLHGEGTANNAAGTHRPKQFFCVFLPNFRWTVCNSNIWTWNYFISAYAMTDEMVNSSDIRYAR